MQRFEFDGEHWRMELSGLTHGVQGRQRAGVWFVRESTGERIYGELDAAIAEAPTVAALVASFERASALERLAQQISSDSKKPFVFKVEHGPVERFEINSERYMKFVQEPTRREQAGYIATETNLTFDESALVNELSQAWAFSGEEIEASIARARSNYAATPRYVLESPNDRIALQRADGTYDVLQVNASGERVAVRTGLSFDHAREITRGHLESGAHAWIAEHTAPDKLQKLA
jgi:hypothetical protein